MTYFTWELPPPSFLKVNFDDSVQNNGGFGGAIFIIRSTSGALIVAGGDKLFNTTVATTEFCAA